MNKMQQNKYNEESFRKNIKMNEVTNKQKGNLKEKEKN